MKEELGIYLQPIDDRVYHPHIYSDSSIGDFIRYHNPDLPSLEGVDLAIVGIKEGRNSDENESCSKGADEIRKALYPLFIDHDDLQIVDLGDIHAGHSIEDSLFAVEQVAYHLIKRSIVPIFIGGADYCGLGIYRAYCRLERMTNIVSIDPIFDVNDNDGEVDVYNYLSRIILHRPGFLFNFTNISYQTYLVNPKMKRVMKKMFFDIHRLGEVNQDIGDMEPIIRQADMLTIDMRSVRASDSPGHRNPLPNGLYGEQLCQMMAQAGTNEKLTSISFFGYNPEFDIRAQSAQLIAQSIWCFIEGYLNRHSEDADFNSDQFTRYRVSLKEDHEIVFYKSSLTDRWWLEVPLPIKQGNRYKRSQIVPCSYKDYEIACDQEVPDRWWQTFQKLH
ncbi:MAG: formimidoylglutamase [Flavobacteriales bacterium]|nr:formimidoylglutamase [Flavobacteriales bacterium]